MKNKILILLLALVMVFTMAIATACEDPTPPGPVKLDITNFWAGNEDEETYTVRKLDSGVEIQYEKHGVWEYAKRSFAYETEEDLLKVKTLVVVGKMVTDTNDPRLTLKIEFKDGSPAKEVSFNMAAESATYEWDLSGVNMDQALTMLLFAEGQRAAANGTITFTEMYLSENAINEDNNVENQVPPAPEKEIDTITSADPVLNTPWYDSGDGVYTVAKEGTGYKLSYDKKSFSWAFVRAYVTGADLANFKTFKITLKGEAGKTVLVKPFDKVEKSIVLTGGEDTVVVDLTKAQGVDYTAAELPVLIFAEPNVQDSTGSITVVKAEFSTEPAPVETVTNEITATNTKVNAGWYPLDAGTYTASKEGNGWKIDYKIGANDWRFGYALVKGEALAEMKTLLITIQGPAGLEIGIKPFDRAEQKFVLTGEEEILKVDLANVGEVDFTQELKVMFFIVPGAEPLEGSFTIKNAEFSTSSEDVTPPVTPTEPLEIDLATIELAGDITDGTDGKPYTVTKADGALKVSFKKAFANGNDWAWSNVNFAPAGMADYEYVKLVVKGKANDRHLFKVEGGKAVEVWATMTGAEQEIWLPVGDNSKVVIFGAAGVGSAEGAAAVSGSFEILSATLAVEGPDSVVDIAAEKWLGAHATIALSDVEGALNVAYTAKSDAWANFHIEPADMSTFSYLKVVVKGTKGDKHLFKAEGAGAKEVWYVMTGEVDTIYIPLNGHKALWIFPMGGSTDVTGSFVIQSITLTNDGPGIDVDLTKGWSGSVDTDEDDTKSYAISTVEGVTTVNYAKAETGTEWSYAGLSLADYALYPYIQITIKGAADQTLLFKTESGAAGVEYKVITTGESQTFLLPLDGRKQLTIFANPGKSGGTGSFVIQSIKVMGTEKVVVLEDVTVDLSATKDSWTGDIVGGTSPKQTYTLAVAEGNLTLTYNKTDAKYSAVGIEFANLAKYKYMVITFKGDAGKIHIWKVQGGSQKEIRVECTGEWQTIILDNSGANPKFVLMAEGDTATATGTIIISSIKLTNTEPVLPAESQTYVLEAKDLTAFGEGDKTDGATEQAGTDNFFTLVYSAKTKVDSSSKTFADGYESAQRVNFGGKATTSKNHVAFTTTGSATVKIWWVCGGDGRQVAIFDAEGTVVTKTAETSVKNELYVTELTLEQAGSFLLGGDEGNNYIFKIEVVVTPAA